MKQHLDALRTSRPDCHVVAYGDAAARLVLRASHDSSYRREHLDHLCAQAATSFSMQDIAAETWSGVEQVHEAIVMSGKTTTLFLRDSEQTSEFLCLVCGRGAELESLATEGRKTLALISADL